MEKTGEKALGTHFGCRNHIYLVDALILQALVLLLGRGVEVNDLLNMTWAWYRQATA